MGTFLSFPEDWNTWPQIPQEGHHPAPELPPDWCPAPQQKAADLLRRWQRVMTGSQMIESLITMNPQGSHLTLGEPQFPALSNGVIRTSLLGLMWDGVTTRRIYYSKAVTTLGMHPMWQVIYVLSFPPYIHPIREVLWVVSTSQRLNGLPKLSQPVSGEVGIWVQSDYVTHPSILLVMQHMSVGREIQALRKFPIGRSPQSPHLTRWLLNRLQWLLNHLHPMTPPHRLPQEPTLRQKEALGTSEPSLPCSLLIPTSSLPYSEELHELLFQQEEKVPSHES